MASMPRAPQAADFAAIAAADVVPPPQSQPAVNVLILLHGLGDSNASFTSLGRNLNLPYTTCVSLQAPTPLPFDLGGFHWGDDIIFDQASGQMEFDTGFRKSSVLVKDVINKVLITKCNFAPQNILLFGFGQGAMVALAVALEAEHPAGLAGVVSIGGYLPRSATLPPASGKSKTPVLVCHGKSNTLLTPDNLTMLRNAFQTVEAVQWPRNGDPMPSNRAEMLPIMRFFAAHLKSRAGVPEGAVEIT